MSDRRTLSVMFRAVDDMSNRISQIANTVRQAAQNTEQFGRNANQAFSNATQSAERMAQSVSRTEQEMSRYTNSSNQAVRAGEQIEQSSRRAAQELNGQAQSQQQASDAARRMTQSQEQASSATNNAQRAVQDAANAVDNLGNQTEQTSEQTRCMGETEQHTSQRTDEMRQQMERARDEHGRFCRQTDETRQSIEQNRQETDRQRESLQNLGSILASAGIVVGLKKIADAALECASAAETVETSLAKLQTISGESVIGSLSNQIADLSNSSGIAAENLADVAYNAISAGTDAAESVNMAQTASKLAAAGFTDTSSALSTLETALNSYGDAAGSAEDISDSLIMVQNLGVTTVAELASNMGRAIATASAYDVSLGNLESAFISTTKSGISTAESTTYISSMLNELGKSGTTVSNTLQEKTGQSFGQLMSSGKTLADVLGILSDSVNGNSEAMMNLWGSAEAGKAAAAVINQGLDTFNDNLQTVQNSAGVTKQAFQTMANTTAHAHTKMENAAKNVSVAIGNQLNPALSKFYDMMAKVFTKMGETVNEHPKVVSAVSAVGISLGTLTAAVIAYTAATKVAAFTTSVAGMALTSINPIFIATAAIAALTAGIMAYRSATAEDPNEKLSASSQKLADSISETEAEYSKACVKFGDTSNEAMALKEKINALNEEFQNSKQTVGELYSEIDNLTENHDKIVSSYDEENEKLSENKYHAANLITQLRKLKIETNGSVLTNEKAKAIVSKLNEEYPELGTNIGEVATNLDGLEKKLKKVNEAQTKQESYKNASGTYADLVEEQAQLEEAKEKAYENYMRANNAMADQSFWENVGTFSDSFLGRGLSAEYDDAEEKLKEITQALEENKQKQQECTDTMQEYANMVNGTGEAEVSAYDAASTAIEQNKDEIQSLVEKYYEAYTAAQESVQGQYSFWEEVKNGSTSSMEQLNAALDSQIAYWNSYSQNLQNLQNRNINGLREMVASMDDGSEESAAALQAMAGASDKQLRVMVQKFNELKGKQDETSANMADNATGFNTSMDSMGEKMKQTVDGMKMDSEADKAAKVTMDAYVNRLRSYAKSASDAAKSVSNAAANALNRNAIPVNAPQSIAAVQHNASGTRSSAPIYVAGEEGPELIVSGSDGGDTVYTADQTRRIADALMTGDADPRWRESGNPVIAVPQRYVSTERKETENINSRNITIEIKGTGSIKSDGRTSPETVWNNAKGQLKQTIIDLLQDEMYEEGDGTYEY